MASASASRDSLGQTLAVSFLSDPRQRSASGQRGRLGLRWRGHTHPLPSTWWTDGVLRHFLHSEATARAFGVPPTGHAGMGAKVSVGSDWLEIGAQPRGVAAASRASTALSASDGPRLVVIDSLSALHAGVKASQGSFSLPFDGWLVREGGNSPLDRSRHRGR
jgi:PmbA protein